MKFHFKGLLQNSGWLKDVCVDTDPDGRIASLKENSPPAAADETINGFCMPGFQNAHSHAFQYAMAGLAETHPPGNNSNDFWSWRDAMYRVALSVTPAHVEAIAAMVYAEMLRHGYTHVAEFHYLHHNTSGLPYMNIAEMGERLVSAAKRAGIGITLLPVFYQKGGFGKPPLENQRRFISSDVDSYARLYEASSEACKAYDQANIGIAIHSMRGVDADAIKTVAGEFRHNVPFHIHIAEQKREVSDSLSYLGKRPVEWMLDNIALSERFHFVHATHINNAEIYGLAHMNVNVVLCPTTEGNLGDGIFPLGDFQGHGGRWSIGTDSHVSLNPFEELRLLDYGQRVSTHKRNTFATRGGDSASYAIGQSLTTGRLAMNNRKSEYFKIGDPFDACVISRDHPLILTSSIENLLNTIVYSSDESMKMGTIIRGKWISIGGRHINQKEISRRFINALSEIGIR